MKSSNLILLTFLALVGSDAFASLLWKNTETSAKQKIYGSSPMRQSMANARLSEKIR